MEKTKKGHHAPTGNSVPLGVIQRQQLHQRQFAGWRGCRIILKNGLYDLLVIQSGRDSALLHHPPLRTVRASFPAYSSSLCKALFNQSQQPTFILGYGVACGSSDVAIPSWSFCRRRLELLEGRDEDSIPFPSLFSLRISDINRLVHTTELSTCYFP